MNENAVWQRLCAFKVIKEMRWRSVKFLWWSVKGMFQSCSSLRLVVLSRSSWGLEECHHAFLCLSGNCDKGLGLSGSGNWLTESTPKTGKKKRNERVKEEMLIDPLKILLLVTEIISSSYNTGWQEFLCCLVWVFDDFIKNFHISELT